MITETFSLFTDDTLTSEFGGFQDLIHYTDLSDNPQDFVLYFGSLGGGGLDTTDRRVQASSDPGVDNIVLSINYILPEWDNNTAYSLGDCVEPTTPDGYRYEVTTAGTSHATTEPVWSGMGGLGSTIVDGTVTWTKVSAKHPTTEIKLATSSGGLPGATGGVSLSLGNTVTSGTSNLVEVHMRVTNTVTTVGNNTATPELALSFVQLIETDV